MAAKGLGLPPAFPPNGLDMLAMGSPDKPMAYIFDLPLNTREALAYMAVSADAYSEEQRAIVKAWVVKMTLVHGSWVAERFAGIMS